MSVGKTRTLMCSRWCSSWAWVALLGAMALAGCPDDEAVTREVDAETSEVEVEVDTAVEVDTVDPERHLVTVTLDPPGIGTLSGWIVLNRFGRWVTDSRGVVEIEVARQGLTLSLVLPAGVAAEDPRVPSALVVPTLFLDEVAPATTMQVDVVDGAVGLVLLDPRFLTDDPFLLSTAMARAYASPAVARLAAVIDTRFDARGVRVLLADPEVLAALDVAVDEVAAAVGTMWMGPTRLPRDGLGDGSEGAAGDLVVARRSSRARALAELVETGGEVKAQRLPGVPGELAMTLRRVDLERGALLRAEDLSRDDLEVVFGGEPASLEEGGVVAGDAVYRWDVRLDDGPRGESLLARALMAFGFPGTGTCQSLPDGFAAALAAELDCRTPNPFELAAGTRVMRLVEAVATRTLARREARVLPGLDPTSVWTPFAGPVAGSALVAVGKPFEPTATVSGELVVGGRVTLTGALVGREEARVVLRDARGTRVEVNRVDGAGFAFLMPEGLAGEVVAELYMAGGEMGQTEVVLGVLPIEVASVWPPVLDRVRAVRLRGRGFFEGGTLTVGGQVVTLPMGAEDEVEVMLDPAVVGVGEHVLGTATLRVPAGLAATVVPEDSASIRGPFVMLGLSGLWVDSELSVSVRGEPLEVVMLARSETPGTDVEALIDTSSLDIGDHELRLESEGRVLFQRVFLNGGSAAFTRQIEFGATVIDEANTMLREAVDVANGVRQLGGSFRRINMGFQIGGQWHCPLDIEPDEFSYPAPSCPGIYERCDEGWRYDDQRNPNRWWRVTRPPGRGSTGVRCPVIPGPDSWDGMLIPDVHDTVTTASPVSLSGLTVMGPRVRLVLPEARGGGLVVTAPTGNNAGPNEVSLDVVVSDAVGNDAAPVVTLNRARGVRIERLEIRGRQGQCRVALRVVDSADIDIERLSVSGCDTAVELVRSTRVRVGRKDGPVVVLGALEGVAVRSSQDVVVHARIGTRADGEEIVRVPTDRGVWVSDSARVLVTGSAGGLLSEVVMVRNSRGVRVGPFEAGVARTASGVAVIGGMANTRGLRVEGSSRDVVIRDTTAVAASFGIDIADEAEVRLVRVAVGGVADGLGAGPLPEQPLGNFNGGLRIFGGEVAIEGVAASRNALFGVGVFGGRVRVEGLTTRSRAGTTDYGGAQPCGIDVTRGRVTLVGAELVGDTAGVCVRDASVWVGGGRVEAGTGVLVEGGRVELVGTEVEGGAEGGVVAVGGAVTIVDGEVVADGVGVEVDGARLSVNDTSIAADEAVVSRASRARLEGVELLGRVGLVVSGEDTNGWPALVMVGGSIVASERDVESSEVGGAVVLREVAWVTLASADRAVMADGGAAPTGAVDERLVELSGRADFAATLPGATRVVARAHEGAIRMRGGTGAIDSEGSNVVFLDDQDIAVFEIIGARQVAVSASRLSGELRCEVCGDVALNGVSGAGRAVLDGGQGHTLQSVRLAGGVSLQGWAEALMFDTDAIEVDRAMPLARLSDGGETVTWVDGVPDRARVAVGRRVGGELEVLGVVQAIHGRARWAGASAGLVASVSTATRSGAWQRVGRPESCEAETLAALEVEAVGDLRWETGDGWVGSDAIEVAACGEVLAEVQEGRPRRLLVDGVEVASANELGDVAFDSGCERVVWVGVDGTRDVFVTELATGVTTRVTEDAVLESRPRFSADGAIWFGVGDGSALVEARDGELTEFAIGGATVGAPTPGADGLVFVVCEASCRLARWDGGPFGSWRYLDTAALGEDGACEASEPRWIDRGGEPPLIAYVRGDGQLVLATRDGVVLGAIADGVLRVR